MTREAEQDPLSATPRYVLEHGRFFQPAPLPPEIEPGKGLDCYMNARFLMAEHLVRYLRPGWLYVEGTAWPRGGQSACMERLRCRSGHRSDVALA